MWWTWSLRSDTWSPAIWSLIPEAWHVGPDTRHLEPGIWHLAPSPWHLEPRTWDLGHGTCTPSTWNLKPGSWHLHFELADISWLQAPSEAAPRNSLWKKFPKNFAKFTGKHMCQSLFFDRVQPQACNFIKNKTPTQVFSCEIYEHFKNTPFNRTLKHQYSHQFSSYTVCLYCSSLPQPYSKEGTNTVDCRFLGGTIKNETSS